jgi:hypothetical protein
MMQISIVSQTFLVTFVALNALCNFCYFLPKALHLNYKLSKRPVFYVSYSYRSPSLHKDAAKL